MTNSLSPSDLRFLRGLNQIQARMDRAQRQVTSGKRIFSAADEPDGISPLLSTRSELAANAQLKNNLGRTKAEVDAAEGALSSAVKTLESARVLAGQAQSDFNSESTWTSLSLQASDLTQQLLNISNLAVEGRYVFSGNSDTVQPFDFDPNLGAVTAYAGSASTRQSLYPGGSPFDIAHSGDAIFDNQTTDSNGISKSAFAALQQLKAALDARDVSAVKTSMQSIEAAFHHVSDELSFYGTAQSRVYDATAATGAADLRLNTQLNRLESADYTQSILDMQQAEFNQQSALQIRAQRPRTSLFDFLG
ncbi:flagellin [Bryobacter aggregatus]|uniref:flagellin N-terminal helical domain-containing protein n=1 Tax=Bryobacter aggregatus TaxID=360054 RepID=UPI0004E1DB52|nr:flagellin [Bryobacter aggregatus]